MFIIDEHSSLLKSVYFYGKKFCETGPGVGLHPEVKVELHMTTS